MRNIVDMTISKVYPLYVNKVLRKGRSQEEVDKVIYWMTGYSEEGLKDKINSNCTLGEFFDNAPSLNPNRLLVKGKICGIQIEEIEDQHVKEIRILDKLIDELAKGKSLDKILR